MTNRSRKYPPANLAPARPLRRSRRPGPFELNDCDRTRLAIAAQRRAGMSLSDWDRAQADGVDRMIATYGYAVSAIGTGECSHPGCDGGLATDPYSYTIGRSFFGVAELVTTGLGAIDALHVTNAVGQQAPWEWQPGIELHLGDERFRLDAVDSMWLECDRSRLAGWFRDFARFQQPPIDVAVVWQIVWADANGKFPDEAGCDPAVVDQQPLLACDPISYPPIDFDMEWHDACGSS